MTNVLGHSRPIAKTASVQGNCTLKLGSILGHVNIDLRRTSQENEERCRYLTNPKKAQIWNALGRCSWKLLGHLQNTK